MNIKTNKLYLALLTLGTYLFLSINPITVSANDEESSSTNYSELDPELKKIDPATISDADISVLIKALDEGINPEKTVLSTRFHCYSVDQTDLSKAAVVFSFDDASVQIKTPSGNHNGHITYTGKFNRILLVEQQPL